MNTDAFPDPISSAIEPLRTSLREHPLYPRLQTLENLQVFMEHHVFAVWDFMSLLKTLQRRLTCVNVPWVPQGEPAVRALINEIVLGEESDRSPDGRPNSHFELYLEAMHEAGATTTAMDEFICLLCDGVEVEAALAKVRAPECVRDFLAGTFQIIREGKIHAVAAAFTYGREDLIPSMFGELVGSLNTQFPARWRPCAITSSDTSNSMATSTASWGGRWWQASAATIPFAGKRRVRRRCGSLNSASRSGTESLPQWASTAYKVARPNTR